MIGPIMWPVAFGLAGWFAERWVGVSVGIGIGLLLTAAVAAGAVWWARTIGSLLEPEDAWEHAPRPPGFTAVCDWVYERTLRVR